MLVTREQLVKKLASETGFWQKDIRAVLDSLNTVVLECFNEATEGEDVNIQVCEGIKVGCKIVKERERINPKTRQSVICKPTMKPFCKFSVNFRQTIQQQYDNKMEE